MSTTKIEVGSFVKVGLSTLCVEEIDEDQNEFWGSDSDGDERWYLISQIDAVIP